MCLVHKFNSCLITEVMVMNLTEKQNSSASSLTWISEHTQLLEDNRTPGPALAASHRSSAQETDLLIETQAVKALKRKQYLSKQIVNYFSKCDSLKRECKLSTNQCSYIINKHINKMSRKRLFY